jgi:hypothetical protein
VESFKEGTTPAARSLASVPHLPVLCFSVWPISTGASSIFSDLPRHCRINFQVFGKMKGPYDVLPAMDDSENNSEHEASSDHGTNSNANAEARLTVSQGLSQPQPEATAITLMEPEPGDITFGQRVVVCGTGSVGSLPKAERYGMSEKDKLIL